MERKIYLEEIAFQFQVNQVCAILGPRQVGKTTLAKKYVEAYNKEAKFFDLEDPTDLALLDNAMAALSKITDNLIVIDEIQRRPELFQVLRVLVDDKKVNRKFLILGSASRDLIHQSSETLAGRISYIELPPFSLSETKESNKLWLRGGFPNSFLAKSEIISYQWRQNYITTFLERDIPNLGFNIPPIMLRRFWLMLSNYHGQIFNSSEIAKSLGVSNHTVRRYLDILAGTFMVRILVPWFENISKRQVKSPKIYFRDSGILNALLGIKNENELDSTARLGSFWEGFALEEIIREYQLRQEDCFFWATQQGAELDLLLFYDGKRLGFEIKYTDQPRITKSMRIAIEDLNLDLLVIVYPGNKVFYLTDNIMAFGLDSLIQGENLPFNKRLLS